MMFTIFVLTGIKCVFRKFIYLFILKTMSKHPTKIDFLTQHIFIINFIFTIDDVPTYLYKSFTIFISPLNIAFMQVSIN